MGNNDLIAAKEEIRRLRLIIGMNQDGSVSNDYSKFELNEDKIRAEMKLRVKIMEEMEEIKRAEEDMIYKDNKYETTISSYNSLAQKRNENIRELESKELKRDELFTECEETTKLIYEAQKNLSMLTNKKRELDVNVSKIKTEIIHKKNDLDREDRRNILNSMLNTLENLEKDCNYSIKRYNDLVPSESKKKLKGNVDNIMSRKFEIGVKIDDTDKKQSIRRHGGCPFSFVKL